MFGEIKQTPGTTSASTSTSTSTRTTCTSPVPSSAPSTGCASSGASTSTTARCGCARPTSATTATASSSGATASPAYISGDLAYYLDKRERGFDHVIIMLGADHHGYVGRLMAMCAVLRRRPVREPRDPDRPAGQPGQGRRAAADEQARRHGRHAGGPRRCRRCRRRSLRPRAVLDRLDARHRPRPADQAHQRQPGLLRAVRARAHLLAAAQRGRPGARLRGRRVRPLRCSTTSARASCSARSASSRGWSQSAAELREPHRVARYLEELAGTYHRFYDACRVLPRGDEVADDTTQARLLLDEATRQVLANGLDLLGVTAPERM